MSGIVLRSQISAFLILGFYAPKPQRDYETHRAAYFEEPPVVLLRAHKSEPNTVVSMHSAPIEMWPPRAGSNPRPRALQLNVIATTLTRWAG